MFWEIKVRYLIIWMIIYNQIDYGFNPDLPKKNLQI